MTSLTPAGGYDRRAIMRKAHDELASARRRGADWDFARCLKFAWAIAKAQRARLIVVAPFPGALILLPLAGEGVVAKRRRMRAGAALTRLDFVEPPSPAGGRGETPHHAGRA